MEDIEKQALALVNEVRAERRDPPMVGLSRDCFASQEALCRAIERHDAFKQEVSDAVKDYDNLGTEEAWSKLNSFVLPSPDPLVEVIADYKRTKGTGEYATNKDMAAALRAALAARGLKIVEVGHD